MTKKEWAFIRGYIDHGNVAKAASEAGYGSTCKSSHVLGMRLLEKVGIRRAVESRLKALAMSQDEVLARIAERAASSAEDFVTVRDKDNPHALPYLDLRKARRQGQLGNIKKLKTKRTPGDHPQEITEVEVHDGLPALVFLAKCYGLGEQEESTAMKEVRERRARREARARKPEAEPQPGSEPPDAGNL